MVEIGQLRAYGVGKSGCPERSKLKLCTPVCDAKWPDQRLSGLTCINNLFMMAGMIRSFSDVETERFYLNGKSRRVPTEIRARAARRLTQLDAATRVEDLRLPPSNQLEALKGDRKGQWSIRINNQWRVCFRFDKGDSYDVGIVDYH